MDGRMCSIEHKKKKSDEYALLYMCYMNMITSQVCMYKGTKINFELLSDGDFYSQISICLFFL